MKIKHKKILDIVLNFILGMVILVAIGMTVLSLTTKEKGVSNIFGYIPISIKESSMGKKLYVGDLAITKKVKVETLTNGDIISFFTISGDKTIIRTHRIVEVKNIEKMVSYVTKGDKNKKNDDYEVAPGDIISKYEGKRIPKMGYIIDGLKKRNIFFAVVILPLFGLFIYQLYNFIIDLRKKKKTLVE